MNQTSIFLVIIMTALSNTAASAALNKLPLCPNSPNCVSSQAQTNDKEHYIEPFKIISTSEDVWSALKETLKSEARTIINKEADDTLQAEVTSLIFRFVDDLHIILDKDAKLIHIRSASRTGYSDLGVNRKRVETLRLKLQQLGLIE
ncbi:MAG: DUF1499 domain-containing protein [Methylococcaceae bacterium]|nr:DUF1499 domain-containing protein [Methylococcaceae bacterium]